jgi:hypothetical protein
MKYAISFAWLLVLASLCCAQDAPRGDVAVEYSPIYILKGYTVWVNGGGGSAAFNINSWIGIAGDFGAYLGHVPESITGETYMAGPRISFRKVKLGRITPFAQALFGGAHFSESTGGVSGGGSDFVFSLGGGGDLALGQSSKFALRGEANYFGIRSFGATTSALRLGAGIVYRF